MELRNVIPKIGMHGVSREIILFWYEIHTFVLTVYGLLYSLLCMWSPFNYHNVEMANFAFIYMFRDG